MRVGGQRARKALFAPCILVVELARRFVQVLGLAALAGLVLVLHELGHKVEQLVVVVGGLAGREVVGVSGLQDAVLALVGDDEMQVWQAEPATPPWP